MDKDELKRAYRLSLLLTGAGQIFLGEKKKGWLMLIFSLLGMLIVVGGIYLIFTLLWEIRISLIAGKNTLLGAGIVLVLLGLGLILILGLYSLKDIKKRL